jgi:hypothetical protein
MNNFKGMYKTGIFYDTKKTYRTSTPIKTENEYKKFLEITDAPIELVGGTDQQVKPYFDCDPSFPKNVIFDETMFCVKIGAEIQKMFPGKPVYYKKRQAREKDGKIRYSIRFVVGQVRISNKNIKEIIKNHGFSKNEPFDTQVYGKNQGLFSIYTNKKVDVKTTDIYEVPPLIPFNHFTKQEIHGINITDYWVSYIEEDYEDWDLKFADKPVDGPTTPKSNVSTTSECNEDEDTDKYANINLQELITHLKSDRADDHDSWINGMWAILNACDAKGLKRKQAYELANMFSAKCQDKYNEDDIYDWLSKNYDKRRESGYRFKFLLEWVKLDAPEYYRGLFKKKVQILSYEQQKEEFERDNSNFFVKKPLAYVHKIKGEEEFCKKINFTSIHEGIQCYIKNKKTGEDDPRYFIDAWYKDANKLTYDRYVWLPPPLVCPDDDYNSWKPLKFSKMENTATERDYWKEFYDYTTNLFGNERVRDYILARYAFRLQNCGLRTHVCSIFFGEEGDGKSMFISIIYSLFGEYALQIGKASDMYGDHSMVEYKKLFICVNEAEGVDNFQNAGVLKTKITEDKIFVNPKNIQAFEIDNFADYDMTTNNLNVIKFTDKSKRRWFQLETTSYYRGNSEFFNDMKTNILNNPVALKQIYDGLMKFDYKKVIPSGNFQDENDKPDTDVGKQVRQMNRDKIIYFLQDYCIEFEENNMNVKWEDDYEPKCEHKNIDLFNKWCDWATSNRVKLEYNAINFGMKLSSINKSIEKNIKMKGICKDTKHSKTTIYPKVMMKYIEFLDK